MQSTMVRDESKLIDHFFFYLKRHDVIKPSEKNISGQETLVKCWWSEVEYWPLP